MAYSIAICPLLRNDINSKQMAYSQSDIGKIVDGIVNQYNGQRISYFGSFPGASRVPIAYYIDELRGTSPAPPMANDRADGWGTDFPVALAALFRHEVCKKNLSYPKGTILMWDTPHTAIVLYSEGGPTARVFEQGAELGNSPCIVRSRTISDCTYALIPIVKNITMPKKVTFGPVNIPAATVIARYNAPKGGLKLPVKEEKIYIRTTILGFSSYTTAAQHKNAVSTVSSGNYYVYRQTDGMLNICKEPRTPGYWINPTDNVVS